MIKHLLTEQLNHTILINISEESKANFFFTFNIENSFIKDLFVNVFSIHEDLYQEQAENIARIMNTFTIIRLLFITQ